MLPLLFAANTVSAFAQGITTLAVPWYFSHTLKDSGTFGLGYGIITFIATFWILLAGTLVDRYPRKTLFLTVNGIGALALGLSSIIGYLIGGMTPFLALFGFGITLLIYNIHYSNLYALGQEISEPQYYGRINSYLEIQGQVTAVLSGAAAILMGGSEVSALGTYLPHVSILNNVKPWPLEKIFALNAIAYLLSGVLMSFLKYQPIEEHIIQKGSIKERLTTGLNYLKARPRLYLFGWCALTIFVLTLVHEFYLLSIYVDVHLEASAVVYASSQLFYAVGAVLAGLIIRHVFAKWHPPTAIVALIIVGCLATIILALSNSISVLYIFALVLGLTNAGTRIMRITYLFWLVPNEFLGRINSVLSITNALQRTGFIFLFTLPFFGTKG